MQPGSRPGGVGQQGGDGSHDEGVAGGSLGVAELLQLDGPLGGTHAGVLAEAFDKAVRRQIDFTLKHGGRIVPNRGGLQIT